MSELAEVAKTGGKRMTTMGVIAIVLGMLALLAPGLTGFSIVMLLGVLVLLAGIVRMIWAFQAGTAGKGLLMFLIGALTLVCGIALLANPIFASGVLTILLTVYFLVDGVAEILAGMQARPAYGWGWPVFGGVVSVLLGIMIWAQFPLSGAWAMGILLGIKLFFVGIIMITSGSVLGSLAKP